MWVRHLGMVSQRGCGFTVWVGFILQVGFHIVSRASLCGWGYILWVEFYCDMTCLFN